MRERIEISKAQQLDENNLINSCYEIFGACRHKTRFHRFLKEKQSVKSTSTDEGVKPERVDKADGKGRSDEKSHLGRRVSVASSLHWETPPFARQFRKTSYV